MNDVESKKFSFILSNRCHQLLTNSIYREHHPCIFILTDYLLEIQNIMDFILS